MQVSLFGSLSGGGSPVDATVEYLAQRVSAAKALAFAKRRATREVRL